MNNLRRPENNILTRDQAHTLLQEYYDDLVAVVQKGLDKFVAFQGGARVCARPRTLANVLNDCIVSEASVRFDGEKHVSISDEYEGRFFIFHKKAALRFKKVNTALVPRNVPTRRQHAIRWQQFEISDENIPTVVNVGYQPNVIFTEISALSLCCRRGGFVRWEIPLVNDMQSYLFDNEGKATISKPAAPIVRPKLIGTVVSNG